MQKDILKNSMIREALEKVNPVKRNYEPRFRDKRPFKDITNECSLMLHPVYRLKVSIGEILIDKIQKELGVK